MHNFKKRKSRKSDFSVPHKPSVARINCWEKNKIYRPVKTSEAKESATAGRFSLKKFFSKFKNLKLGVRIVIVTLVASILLGCIASAVISASRAKRTGESGRQSGEISSVLDSVELMQYVKSIKANLFGVLDGLKAADPKQAKSSLSALDQDSAALREYLSSPFWQLASKTPGIRREMSAAANVIDLLDDASRDLLWPLVEFTEENPFSSLITDHGYDVGLIVKYLDFAEKLAPAGEDIALRFRSIDFGKLDNIDKISDYKDKIDSLLSLYHENEHYIPFLKTFLAGEGSRHYLIIAQNSAEIRASGGFPGSVGVISIQDGFLTFKDFKTVYSYFKEATPKSCNITAVETTLFQGRLGITWDSVFCPDFPRVAYILASAYKAKNTVPIDGVISATPVIIQKLLKIAGEVTLEDGTKLNGKNATRILQHDLYFQYLGADSSKANGELIDKVFSDAANKTIAAILKNINLDTLPLYMDALREFVDSRNFMLWMQDEQEQKMVAELGWSGTIHSTEEEPVVGVYFNGCTASKLGWYIDIDTQLGEGTENPDGSVTYDMKVTFTNNMDEEERSKASLYIYGEYRGALICSGMIVAPEGGMITQAVADASKPILMKTEYEGLDVTYFLNKSLGMESSFSIDCKVTTAPGVDAPLTVRRTPTLTEYR